MVGEFTKESPIFLLLSFREKNITARFLHDRRWAVLVYESVLVTKGVPVIEAHLHLGWIFMNSRENCLKYAHFEE